MTKTLETLQTLGAKTPDLYRHPKLHKEGIQVDWSQV